MILIIVISILITKIFIVWSANLLINTYNHFREVLRHHKELGDRFLGPRYLVMSTVRYNRRIQHGMSGRSHLMLGE